MAGASKKSISCPRVKKSGGLAAKLEAVAPEYRCAEYQRLTNEKAAKRRRRGSPVVTGSFENGKRK